MATETPSQRPYVRSVLDLEAAEARSYFLKAESYCDFELPEYFSFDAILKKVSATLTDSSVKDYQQEPPGNHERVNHTLITNKDGQYSWRPFQLVHPALYVDLVHALTETATWQQVVSRIKHLQSQSPNIICAGMPVVSTSDTSDKASQISTWWHEIEQRSIREALRYNHVIHTDIADCYGSIYTHAITWALHDREFAQRKENRGKSSLIGDSIDRKIRWMQRDQSNGIPQGNRVSDFIAEIVLCYADSIISDHVRALGLADFIILRYRDDYRILTTKPTDSEMILRCISKTLMELGLKLNTSKTFSTSETIRHSIKKDKMSWMEGRQFDQSLQKHIMIIHSHATKHPNSGSLVTALSRFDARLARFCVIREAEEILSICFDVAIRNPRTFPYCSAIISKLLEHIDSKDRIIATICKRLKDVPNTGYMQLWLQRIGRHHIAAESLDEPLCHLAGRDTRLWEPEPIWNSCWINDNSRLAKAMETPIFDHATFDTITDVIPHSVIELFASQRQFES